MVFGSWRPPEEQPKLRASFDRLHMKLLSIQVCDLQWPVQSHRYIQCNHIATFRALLPYRDHAPPSHFPPLLSSVPALYPLLLTFFQPLVPCNSECHNRRRRGRGGSGRGRRGGTWRAQEQAEDIICQGGYHRRTTCPSGIFEIKPENQGNTDMILMYPFFGTNSHRVMFPTPEDDRAKLRTDRAENSEVPIRIPVTSDWATS